MPIKAARATLRARLHYDIVRSHAAFYDVDRPLSAEVEAIERKLASNHVLAELIALAPLPELDDVFALRAPV